LASVRRYGGGMTKTPLTLHLAMAAAIDLPDAAVAPDWIHLLPATSGAVHTFDARGPYLVRDADAIIAASFATSDALEVDVNHATYNAAPNGGRSDAVGWVKEMQIRDDGIWGRVEWIPEGQKLVADKAYRKISPVFIHDIKKNILRIANVSLVNRPNLRGLTALNQETTTMSFKDSLTDKLGLPRGASEDAILAAIPNPDATTTAMQSALTTLGAVMGVQCDAAALLAP